MLKLKEKKYDETWDQVKASSREHNNSTTSLFSIGNLYNIASTCEKSLEFQSIGANNKPVIKIKKKVQTLPLSKQADRRERKPIPKQTERYITKSLPKQSERREYKPPIKHIDSYLNKTFSGHTTQELDGVSINYTYY
jgi:hypothetical protein